MKSRLLILPAAIGIAVPGPAQARRWEQFLCGQSSPTEKRAVVRELLHRAGRRAEEG